jgi:hypothetical protein
MNNKIVLDNNLELRIKKHKKYELTRIRTTNLDCDANALDPSHKTSPYMNCRCKALLISSCGASNFCAKIKIRGEND